MFVGLTVLPVLLLAVVNSQTGPAVVEAVAVPNLTLFPHGQEILYDQLK